MLIGLALVLIGGLAVRWALPPVHFPDPTGAYAVGTATAEWTDPDRGEPATDDPDDRRFVVAQLWYPADYDATAPRAWYLGRDRDESKRVARGVAESFGLPTFLLDRPAGALTAAVVGATAVTDSQRLPIVLFSPGLSGIRQQNTAWAIDLASHGYLVVALDHPFDSAIVVRADGSTVTSQNRATGDDAEDRRRANATTAIRAADLRFALSRLAAVDAGDEDPVGLAGRLDLDHVAAAGHSLGGAAAVQAAALDPRIDAAIDIDGFPRLPSTPKRHPPVLVLVAGRGTGNPDSDRTYATAVDQLLAASARPSYRLVVPEVGHLGFTDAALYLPPVPSLIGTAGRTAGITASTEASLAFLDVVLRSAPGDGLDHALGRFGAVQAYGR